MAWKPSNSSLSGRTLHFSWMLVPAFALILLGVFQESWWDNTRWESAARTIGVTLGSSFGMAFLLAVLIDAPIKTDIATQAFRRAIGLGMADQLAAELPWFREQYFIVSNHEQRVTLEPIADGDLVSVRTYLRRTFENIDTRPQRISAVLEVPEWFHVGSSSEITQFLMDYNGKVYTDYETAIHQSECEELGTATRVKLANAPEIRPGDSCQIIYETVETKHSVDDHWRVFTTATVNPRVIIDAPDDMAVSVGFSTRETERCRRPAHNEFRLDGTLLPHQSISVKWCPLQKATAFVESRT